jgi:hypothetical protein
MPLRIIPIFFRKKKKNLIKKEAGRKSIEIL